ncbi:protein KHNYN-like isoform X2, partial [Silurus asotus]
AGEQQVEDEFTCPGVLQGPLINLKPTVDRVFGVTLKIFGEDTSYDPEDGQIWLQLNGRKEEVEAAKLFIKGFMSQEAQKEVQYPHVLHCVFFGARGLFTDSLIRNTSAHIEVGSVGCILIYGLAEPVVKAYSLVVDLIDKYKVSQSQTTDAGRESMDSRRTFKSVVERLEDSYTLELLVLPVMVKEVLLDLVKQSGTDPNTLDRSVVSAGATKPLKLQEMMNRLMLSESKEKSLENLRSTTVSSRANGTPFPNFPNYKINNTGTQNNQIESPSQFFRCLGAGPEPSPAQQAQPSRPIEPRPGAAGVDLKNQNTDMQKWSESRAHDIKMETESNQEDQHGESLLSTTSRQENEHLLKFFTAMGFNDEVVCRVLARTGPREPSQVLDLIQQEQDKTVIQILKQEMNGTPGATKESPLNEEKKTEKTEGKSGRTEKTDNHRSVNLEGVIKTKQNVQAHGRGRPCVGLRTPAHLTEPDKNLATITQDPLSSFEKPTPFHTISPSVCGPPQPTYPSSMHPNMAEEKKLAPLEPTPRFKHKPPPTKAAAVITGQQRFLEGLVTPFVLQLKDGHCDPGLRQIIIDGSNVAMTHGLGIFFSCRGIALAVEYFWNQGHRKITALVPQWRQKKDSKIKEQHFMAQLQDLGLLSYTPSREFEGQRINSYDDRFMLQLAMQTDGVIVTNDNMRDLVDVSVGWKEIIKKRLLQYVFAGDLFMVPDDPLGRSGPHIKDFLRTQNRFVHEWMPPAAGSHTFAGTASNFPQPSPQPRAQTEVLKYRERTPGGANKAHRSARGHSQDRKEMARSAEETLRLKQDLVNIFPGQDSVITMALQCYPTIKDINQLSFFILE